MKSPIKNKHNQLKTLHQLFLFIIPIMLLFVFPEGISAQEDCSVFPTIHSPSGGAQCGDYGNGGCETFIPPVVRVSLNANLGGCFDPVVGEMRTDLQAGNFIPVKEPYEELGFSQAGFGGCELVESEVLDTSTNIVDWVFVELRDFIDPTIIVATQSVLLLKDGSLVDQFENPEISFHGVYPLEYYITIRHRNHVGVMTANPIFLFDISTHIDFTDSTTAFWGTDAQYEIVPGVMAMWAGDTNGDGNTKYQGANNDRDEVKNDILAQPENIFNFLTFNYNDYNRFDANMDGVIRFQGANNDNDLIKNLILAHPGNIFYLLTFTINQQLP